MILVNIHARLCQSSIVILGKCRGNAKYLRFHSCSSLQKIPSSIFACCLAGNFQTSRRYCAQQFGLWDDSNWMKQGDANSEAYDTLDITKLMPFPEYRNVVAGPVWPDDAFNLVWKKYYTEQTPEAYRSKHDTEWSDYIKENEFDPVEYFESEDYKKRYEERLIWSDFIRNHKGSRQKQRTRYACFIKGKMCGNPCPLCRDTKLLLNYRNLNLLNNFIDPRSGMVYPPLRTGVCRSKQKILEHTIWLARDQGLIPTPAPKHEEFDLSKYDVNYAAVQPFVK